MEPHIRAAKLEDGGEPPERVTAECRDRHPDSLPWLLSLPFLRA
jgi:hypothetical protein